MSHVLITALIMVAKSWRSSNLPKINQEGEETVGWDGNHHLEIALGGKNANTPDFSTKLVVFYSVPKKREEIITTGVLII